MSGDAGTLGDRARPPCPPRPVWRSATGRVGDCPPVSGPLATRLRLGQPHALDVRLRSLVVEHRRPGVTRLARAATAVAGGLSPYPVVAAAAALTAPAGHRREASAWAVRRLGAGLGVRFALAQSLRRARPSEHEWLASTSGWSWPSGHTTAATLAAGLAAQSLVRSGNPVWPTVALALPAPLAVGWSRVYLGVHWPSDVLAGWMFGLALLPLSALIPARDPLVALVTDAVRSRRAAVPA